MSPPKWIKPQLCKLAAKAPSGPLWVHEIKFDGYRIAARIDQGSVQLLTRSRARLDR
jgi:bifunctional non-homologous end joining protein LigD